LCDYEPYSTTYINDKDVMEYKTLVLSLWQNNNNLVGEYYY